MEKGLNVAEDYTELNHNEHLFKQQRESLDK